MQAMRWIAGALVVAAVVAVVIAIGSGGSGEEPSEPAPATLKPIKGTDLSQVSLSADAARRLGIRTAPVVGSAHHEVIPYDAVLYAADGQTFTYAGIGPRTFVRRPIQVVRIDGPRAVLSSGPPSGTPVVVVGAQELFGVEYDVEED